MRLAVCGLMCSSNMNTGPSLRVRGHKLSVVIIIMKGTKVQTLGAGREVLPHNMAVTKMSYYLLATRMQYMCIYACAVLLIGGRAGPFYSWSLTAAC